MVKADKLAKNERWDSDRRGNVFFLVNLKRKDPTLPSQKLLNLLRRKISSENVFCLKSWEKGVARDPEVDRRHPTSNLKISPSEVSSMRKTFLSTVRSVEQLWQGKMRVKNTSRSDHFKSYKSPFAKECFLQTQDHPRYKEWEDQETLIGGLTFTKHVWKKTNMLVYLHLGAFFHTCLGFITYMREKAHMCGKSHTTICLQMLGIFHTCVGKANDMLISPWAIGAGQDEMSPRTLCPLSSLCLSKCDGRVQEGVEWEGTSDHASNHDSEHWTLKLSSLPHCSYAEQILGEWKKHQSPGDVQIRGPAPAWRHSEAELWV